MERSAPGPRIYVPISMPDHASQPTYAVLEFVGFSSPAPPSSSTPHLIHSPPPLASPSPAMLCLPPPGPSSSVPPSSSSSSSAFLPLSLTPPLAPLPPNSALIPPHPSQLFPIPHFPAPDTHTFFLPSPSPHLLPHPYQHHHQQHPPPHALSYPSARLEVVNLDSPPSSPSSAAPSSASSASRESSKEKPSQSSTPPVSTHVVSCMGNASVGGSSAGMSKPMVCFNPTPPDACSTVANGSNPRPMVSFTSQPADGASPCGLSTPLVNFSSAKEGNMMQTQISVSQTDRETIVHTHSSNFRDVVRQLTGASSDDQDLLPVTLPARLANRMNNPSVVQNASASAEALSGTGAGIDTGTNRTGGGASKEQLGLRRAPMKLHERRKSTMKNLEKVTTAYSFHGGGSGASEVSPIMNPSPVTPLASDFERFCNASTPTSQGGSGMSSPISLMNKGKSAMEAATGAGGGRAAEQGNQQEGGGGCFFLQRPPPASARPPMSPLEKSAPPTLLSLFPESPACSPRER